MSKSDDDYPEIGKRRRGMVLVCHGDDRPDQFADWLQPLVVEFERLSSLASEFGIDLTPEDGAPPIVSVIDFCDRLSIEFSSTMWEGSLISVYHLGWIKVGTVRSASAHGRKLIRTLEKRADHAIRQAVIRDIQRIKDLDEFIERTADDRVGLREKIAALTETVHLTKLALDAANEKLSKAAESDTQESTAPAYKLRLPCCREKPAALSPARWCCGTTVSCMRSVLGVEVPYLKDRRPQSYSLQLNGLGGA